MKLKQFTRLYEDNLDFHITVDVWLALNPIPDGWPSDNGGLGDAMEWAYQKMPYLSFRSAERAEQISNEIAEKERYSLNRNRD